MAFIPHSPDDIRAMLSAIGADDVEQLFDEIPAAVRAKALTQIPLHLNEAALTRDMTHRAVRDGGQLNFIGAGAYQHHIPAEFALGCHRSLALEQHCKSRHAMFPQVLGQKVYSPYSSS